MSIKIISKQGNLPLTDTDFPNTQGGDKRALSQVIINCDVPANLLMPGAERKAATAADNQYYYLLQQFTADWATIRFYNFYSAEKDILTFFSDPAITFRFATHLSHRLTIDYLDGLDTFHERGYNCFFVQTGYVKYEMAPGQSFACMDIIIKPEDGKKIQEIIPGSSFEKFLHKAAIKPAALLAPFNQVAPIEVLRWVDELTSWAFDTDKQAGLIEEYINQLVWHSLKTMEKDPVKLSIMMSPQEVEKLYKAAAIICTSKAEFTRNEINILARELNISVNRLMAGFEQVYGYSILKHQAEEKMRLALRLVENKLLSEKVIAGRLGFSTPQSFARKFYNRFGYYPYRT